MRDDRKQWDPSFDVAAEVAEMERLSRLQRRHRYRRTPLDRYRGELGQLYAAGLSCAQLAAWLRRRKGLTVSRSAVHRKLKQWPEVEIRKKGKGNA